MVCCIDYDLWTAGVRKQAEKVDGGPGGSIYARRNWWIWKGCSSCDMWVCGHPDCRPTIKRHEAGCLAKKQAKGQAKSRQKKRGKSTVVGKGKRQCRGLRA